VADAAVDDFKDQLILIDVLRQRYLAGISLIEALGGMERISQIMSQR